jgi:hypothetical protein
MSRLRPDRHHGDSRTSPSNWGVPDAVVALFDALAAGCNDTSVAHAHARLQHVAWTRQHPAEPPPDPPCPGAATLGHGQAGTVAPVAAAYLYAAARYATAAVQILSRLADQRPVTVPEPDPIAVADVLAMSQIHVPLVQVPTARWPARPGLVDGINAELAASHARLVAVIDQTWTAGRARSAAGAPTGGVEPAADRDAHLAQALHGYAADCTWATGVLSQPATA